MKNPYFGRLLTAMVTPFNADGSVNYEKAADLAEWLINNGSDGLVVAGSTGEAATMSAEEKLELFRVVVNRINKRVPIIAGTGSNNTADSVKMTKMAEAMGVDWRFDSWSVITTSRHRKVLSAFCSCSAKYRIAYHCL